MSNCQYRIKTVETDDQERVRFLRYTIFQSGESYGGKRGEKYVTTVDQDLELRCDQFGRWDAVMRLHGRMGSPDPQDALGRMGNWLARMAEAVNKLRENMETGLENPVTKEPYRYTLNGLIKKLKDEQCPLDPKWGEDDE